jgi:hypothetical protein
MNKVIKSINLIKQKNNKDYCYNNYSYNDKKLASMSHTKIPDTKNKNSVIPVLPSIFNQKFGYN